MKKDYFDLPKIMQTLSVLEGAIKKNVTFIDRVLYASGKPDFKSPDKLRPFSAGETWGGYDCDAWFRVPVEVSAELAGEPLWLSLATGRETRWDAVNPQFLVYVNGADPIQGMDTNHQEVLLTDGLAAGSRLDVDFDAWSGMVTVDVDEFNSQNNACFFQAMLYNVNQQVKDLYYDIKVPFDAARLQDRDSSEAISITKALVHACNMLDLREIGSEYFFASVNDARDYLQSSFYGTVCGPQNGSVCCIGHTHIDVAWQWTYDHTRRKTQRSFATALALMREYPEYIFMSSQPQLYEFLREEQPALYETIKQRAREGRWEPEGAMWVEADCNLSSGEALIRQIVFGKRFFREEFGVDSKVLWLPDVFGYSAALPQILKGCGVDYFMTTKISWNDHNKVPMDTFYWKGIDESSVLTHFIPVRDLDDGAKLGDFRTGHFTTYNGMLAPNQVMGGWKRYQQKDISEEFLFAYGYGDGGGGTTREMVENLRRLEKGIPGCPVAKPGRVLDFFKRLESDFKDNPRTPEWYGELYLEFHRGTYTSVAKNKRNNRKAEFALQGLEALGVMAAQAGLAIEYPTQSLDKMWKDLLINQFHDVLPGSSIKEVYDDSDAMYKELFETSGKIAGDITQGIAAGVSAEGDVVAVFNTLGICRSDAVEIDVPVGFEGGFHLVTIQGTKIPVQTTAGGKAVFIAPEIPGMGYAALRIIKGSLAGSTATVKGKTVETAHLRLVFNDIGQLCSIYDMQNAREILPAGTVGNRLETYEDRPHAHDAWDINLYHKEKQYDIEDLREFEVVENGAVRTVVKLAYNYLSSTIVQHVVIWNHNSRVDFATDIDWQNDHILLKAAFPVDVVASKAAYEIQYGVVERPTHSNTSWDFAMFETCAQKWADLSETGYGVSLMNDCKFGHDIHDGIMRLTLIKSAMSPYKDADKGSHHIVYSVYPHSGNWRESGTQTQAYNINVPLLTALGDGKGGALPQSMSLASSNTDGVFVEVLKQADSGNGIVLRAYEGQGARKTAEIHTDFTIAKVELCNMLEEPLDSSAVEIKDNRIIFDIKPFQIVTIKAFS